MNDHDPDNPQFRETPAYPLLTAETMPALKRKWEATAAELNRVLAKPEATLPSAGTSKRAAATAALVKAAKPYARRSTKQKPRAAHDAQRFNRQR
jgi:hypothetical protein